MKFNEKQDVIGGNIKSQGGFAIANSAHAFKVLSNGMYKDKIAAIIRELTCNGDDSHTAAGVQAEVIVTLPHYLNSTFSVEDFGLGLSKEQIMGTDEVDSIYTTYFSSQKNQTNALIGGFGLGSKTPFAYTDSFTVISRYNGVETSYLMYLQNSLPNVNIVSEKPTTQRNGVKVCMDVKAQDFAEFQRKAIQQLSWFPKGAVKVQGMANFKPIQYKQEQNILWPLAGEGMSGWFVKVGPVLYTLDKDPHIVGQDFLQIMNNRCLILEFPIGTIDVASNRESLSFEVDGKTGPNIMAACKRIASEYFKNTWTNEFENKPLSLKLVRKAKETLRDFHSSALRTNVYGAKILKISETVFEKKLPHTLCSRYGGRYNQVRDAVTKTAEQEIKIYLNTQTTHIFVKDVDKGYTTRLRSYMNAKQIYMAIMVEPQFYSPTLADDLGGLEVINVSAMPVPPKAPRGAPGAARTAMEVRVWDSVTGALKNEEVSEEDLEDDFFYVFSKFKNIQDNATSVYDTSENYKALDDTKFEACKISTFEGKPVYFLGAKNKRIAEAGVNLIKHLTEKAVAIPKAELYNSAFANQWGTINDHHEAIFGKGHKEAKLYSAFRDDLPAIRTEAKQFARDFFLALNAADYVEYQDKYGEYMLNRMGMPEKWYEQQYKKVLQLARQVLVEQAKIELAKQQVTVVHSASELTEATEFAKAA